MKTEVLIVDAHNNFLRNFMVVPTMDDNGAPVGGLVGAIRSLKCAVRDFKPKRVVLVWDGAGGSRKRRTIFADYKQGRKPRANRTYDFETVEASAANMAWQMEKTRELVSLLGVNQVVVEDVEADDVIAYLCRLLYLERDKVVYSSDRDFLQLIDDRTTVFSPAAKKLWDRAAVVEKFGVSPENFIHFKCLVGDGSDNVPGVKGVGEASVRKLFPSLSGSTVSLDEVLTQAAANLGTGTKYKCVVEGSEILRRNHQLMQLSCPNISVQAGLRIKASVSDEQRHLKLTEFKMALARSGIHLDDQDLFSTFSEFKLRWEPAQS